MSRKLVAYLVLLAAAILGALVLRGSRERELVVFCAGSLKIPLEKLAEEYMKQHPGVSVIIEASGSVEAVRKVTELQRRCDVLALADYRLIPSYMIPEHTSFYVTFATNEIVLCYTDKSKHAGEITADNWHQILRRSGVRYGFSDPNKDPCGYRSVIVIALASLHYGDPAILEELVLEKSNIELRKQGGRLHLHVPASLSVRGGLVVRAKSVDLIALLEAGSLDYAFEYRSVAVQHGLKFIELPSEISLGNPLHEDFYKKASVHILCGTDKEREIEGKPIVYGATIPATAENMKGAVEFLKLLLGDAGREVFTTCGQPFLRKPAGFGELPEELKPLVGG